MEREIASLEVMLPIREQGTLPPLFFVHPASGLSRSYMGFQEYVEPCRPIYGLQARSFTSSGIPPQTIQEMAMDYVDEIRKVQPKGPYHLAGWSIGGMVAYEIANVLQCRGELTAFLSLFDVIPSVTHELEKLPTPEIPSMFDLAVSLFGDDLKGKHPSLSALCDRLRRDNRLPEDFNERHFSVLLENVVRALNFGRGFVPKIYNGDLVVFVAAEERPDVEPVLESWRPYVNGNIRVHHINCKHKDMMQPKALAAIANVFAEELAKV